MDWTGNSVSAFSILGASNHSKVERESNDYYATDPDALEYLLKYESFCNNVWEPAVGGGHLSNVLIDHGYNVRMSDIVDHGIGASNVDFLDVSDIFYGDIITNPPYKYAQEFVEKAISIITFGYKVAMFLKLTFLEGQKRRKLFDKYPPKVVYVFSKRMSCAKNGEFKDPKQSAVAYAWFVWQKGFIGEPVIKWI